MPDSEPLAEMVSSSRFPDGGAFRIEIPSVEGPDVLRAVLQSARDRDLPVHRVSQGSGVAMLDDDEITDMVQQCRAIGVECCLFLGPRATWDIGGATGSPSGGVGPRVRGADQLRHSIDDAERAVSLGVRCLLVADEGVLWRLHSMRTAGVLPADLTLKVSALAGPANPASFSVVEHLGADSINVPSDLTVDQLGELREAGSAAIDFYVESPDGLGGFVRYHDVPAIVRVASPVYLKFGLRNAPELYPVGLHLRNQAVAMGEERVRRAHIAMEILNKHRLVDLMSPVGHPATGAHQRFSLVQAG